MYKTKEKYLKTSLIHIMIQKKKRNCKVSITQDNTLSKLTVVYEKHKITNLIKRKQHKYV